MIPATSDILPVPGPRHGWSGTPGLGTWPGPESRPGRGRPKGWRSYRISGAGGVFGVEEDCIRDELGDGTTCESVRVSHTGIRGIFLDRGVNRQYKRGEHWKIRPEGSRMTRLDVIDYLTWTMGDELFAEGGPEQGEDAIA